MYKNWISPYFRSKHQKSWWQWTEKWNRLSTQGRADRAGFELTVWLPAVITICLESDLMIHLSLHYTHVIMDTMTSQITSLTIVYSTVYSGADQRKHQSSASMTFVRGIHRWPVNSPHREPVRRKMFPFDDVIMRRTFPSVWRVIGWYMIVKWSN